MAVDKFKFVSPGIFIDEIDESGIPALPERMGPLVIGRFQKGPGNRPVKVNSFKEFVQIFGDPAPGNAKGDVFRTGDLTAPTYAAYAVKAWLRNNSPCTVYRVLGEEASNADANGDNSRAGWKTENTPNATLASAGGAYGLFLFPSGSTQHAGTRVTGTIGAIWYVDKGAVILSGSRAGSGADLADENAEGAGALFKSTGGLEFTAKILDENGAVTKTSKFNFNRDSSNFIRKVFNTNPTRVNGDIQSTTVNYWLGETFESNLRNGENPVMGIEGSGLAADAGNFYGAILMLDGSNDDTASDVAWHDHRQAARAAQTGFFISQDTRGGTTAGFDPQSHTENLFKFHALDSGEHANRDFKVSIVDIKVPTDNFNNYGTFTVQVRQASDNDAKPVVLEQFSGCNLDPTSANYIARKVGDRHYTYDSVNKRVVEHGDNENRSAILRVEVSDLVSDGEAAGLIPFGVYGPAVPKTHTISQETNATIIAAGSGSTNCLPNQPTSLDGTVTILQPGHAPGRLLDWPDANFAFTASVVWPVTRLRVSSSEGNLVQPSRAYFGYQSNIINQQRYDHTNTDLLRGQPVGLDPTASPSALQQYSWVFTLDDVRQSEADATHSIYVSGSRASGISWTAVSGTTYILTGSGAKITKFTSPMFGGFDGFDITEQDPFRNSRLLNGTEKNNAMHYSLKKAIDVTSDPDYIEYDLATMPGITDSSLTSQLVTACEERADSLAIIDVAGGYKPPHERSTPETSADALGDVETTVTNLKDMNLNSSYGCAFYPFVKIRDNVANAVLYVPPSVVALGTFSSAQRNSAVWFAPAGFTRGGLSEGSAGLPVIGVRERVNSTERDRLYDANINPIASFPAEGIVIFGQKTLQVTPSALDRINVRRLLIFVKKEISRIASRILFDQNVQQTWDRFKGQVIPFLEGVQAGLGLTDFRVVLDDTTTTPDLVDRNILYAKIFLKPARAIEFIALDFIVTRSGASFDD